MRAAYDAAGVAADTHRAYFSAVAAQELLNYVGQVKLVANASNELAQRMVRAGNFSKLAQMREPLQVIVEQWQQLVGQGAHSRCQRLAPKLLRDPLNTASTDVHRLIIPGDAGSRLVSCYQL